VKHVQSRILIGGLLASGPGGGGGRHRAQPIQKVGRGFGRGGGEGGGGGGVNRGMKSRESMLFFCQIRRFANVFE